MGFLDELINNVLANRPQTLTQQELIRRNNERAEEARRLAHQEELRRSERPSLAFPPPQGFGDDAALGIPPTDLPPPPPARPTSSGAAGVMPPKIVTPRGVAEDFTLPGYKGFDPVFTEDFVKSKEKTFEPREVPLPDYPESDYPKGHGTFDKNEALLKFFLGMAAARPGESFAQATGRAGQEGMQTYSDLRKEAGVQQREMRADKRDKASFEMRKASTMEETRRANEQLRMATDKYNIDLRKGMSDERRAKADDELKKLQIDAQAAYYKSAAEERQNPALLRAASRFGQLNKLLKDLPEADERRVAAQAEMEYLGRGLGALDIQGERSETSKMSAAYKAYNDWLNSMDGSVADAQTKQSEWRKIQRNFGVVGSKPTLTPTAPPDAIP